MTNTTKTIEAIKVLYHGDIDDAPLNTVVAEGAGIKWVLRDLGGGPTWCHEYPDNPGNEDELCQDEYELLKALCLQEPTSDEQKSGVWIDGEFREIVVCNDDDACPFCAEFDGAEHAMNDCKSLWIGNDPQTRKAFWLAPPVKEPEVEQFTVTPINGIQIKVWRSQEDGRLCCSDCEFDDCPHAKAVETYMGEGDGPWIVEPVRKQGAH